MAKNNNLGDFLTDIANAIRTKKGTSSSINAQDFSSEIASIETGGGGAELNLAYGNTAPEDTSKIWVKCNTPSKVLVKTSVGNKNESLQSDLGTPLAGGGGVGVVGTNFYIFGGTISTTGSGSNSSSIQKFDTLTNTLTTLTATLPTATALYSVGVVGTNCFVFNGRTVCKFDTTNETLTTITTTAFDTYSFGAGIGVVGTNCYAFGGRTSSSTYYYRGTIRKFDTLTNISTTLSPTVQTGYLIGVGVVGNKCYTFGGFSGSYSNTIRVFDTTTNTVATLTATLPTACSRMGVGVIGTECYLFGGESASNTSINTIQVFDPETETINTLTKRLPTAQTCSVGASGNNCYILGGFTQGILTPNKNIYMFTAFVSLLENNLLIARGGATKNIPLISDENLELTIDFNDAYLGNSSNIGEQVKVATYQTNQWVELN